MSTNNYITYKVLNSDYYSSNFPFILNQDSVTILKAFSGQFILGQVSYRLENELLKEKASENLVENQAIVVASINDLHTAFDTVKSSLNLSDNFITLYGLDLVSGIEYSFERSKLEADDAPTDGQFYLDGYGFNLNIRDYTDKNGDVLEKLINSQLPEHYSVSFETCDDGSDVWLTMPTFTIFIEISNCTETLDAINLEIRANLDVYTPDSNTDNNKFRCSCFGEGYYVETISQIIDVVNNFGPRIATAVPGLSKFNYRIEFIVSASS